MEDLRKTVLLNNAWRVERLLREQYIYYLISRWLSKGMKCNIDLLEDISSETLPISHLLKLKYPPS
jgi:hypothetical protein